MSTWSKLKLFQCVHEVPQFYVCGFSLEFCMAIRWQCGCKVGLILQSPQVSTILHCSKSSFWNEHLVIRFWISQLHYTAECICDSSKRFHNLCPCFVVSTTPYDLMASIRLFLFAQTLAYTFAIWNILMHKRNWDQFLEYTSLNMASLRTWTWWQVLEGRYVLTGDAKVCKLHCWV